MMPDLLSTALAAISERVRPERHTLPMVIVDDDPEQDGERVYTVPAWCYSADPLAPALRFPSWEALRERFPQGADHVRVYVCVCYTDGPTGH